MAETESHYSLKWNNHKDHLLSSFIALLQAEYLVDVTLVCTGCIVRAHKIVLSACSPFFERIFRDNGERYIVVVLSEYTGWEIQALVDFMYTGELRVNHEQLQIIMKSAENLRIRGLTAEKFLGDKEPAATIINRTPTPSTSPTDYERTFYTTNRFPTPGVTIQTPIGTSSPYSPTSVPNFEAPCKIPSMSHLSFTDYVPRNECHSPLPRRKQAKPRRRSSETCSAQDLSQNAKLFTPMDATPENLCMKKKEPPEEHEKPKEDTNKPPLTPDPEFPRSPELDLRMHRKDYTTSPPLGIPNIMNIKHELGSQSPLPPFPPMPSISALSMAQPHNKFFGLDTPLGLFPPGLDGCRNPLLEMADPRSSSDAPLYVKKKCRAKGQHSAPRGGPPRSWTNAELTDALQQVWNKKMTTSQASRVFGIPYNSLLMYVRGKYGKSLKLEQLRKDCIGGPGPTLDLVNIAGASSSCKSERDSDQLQSTRVANAEEGPPPPPVYTPFTPTYFPDFPTFPIPVNMIHLLPQSEKNREHYVQQPSAEENCKDERIKEEVRDIFAPPVFSHEDRRELVQQNGQG